MGKITAEAFNALAARELPFAHGAGFRAEEIGDGSARVSMPFDNAFLRPGGTISGPAMMALADYGMYAAIMGAIGEVALAVTTSFNINFLRRPAAVDMIGECRALKVGRHLAVIEVTLYSKGEDEPVAHATGTYSIPPEATA